MEKILNGVVLATHHPVAAKLQLVKVLVQRCATQAAGAQMLAVAVGIIERLGAAGAGTGAGAGRHAAWCRYCKCGNHRRRRCSSYRRWSDFRRARRRRWC